MNKQQIIDAAEQIAVGVAVDPNFSNVIDSEMTAEDLLPLAMEYAVNAMLDSGASVQGVSRTHTLTLAEGPFGLFGALPASVIVTRDRLGTALLPDFKWSTYVRSFLDFQRQQFTNLLCAWTVFDGVFYTTCGMETESEESTESDESGSEESFEVRLFAVSRPEIPNNAIDEIAMTEDLQNAVIATLAKALRGELKL